MLQVRNKNFSVTVVKKWYVHDDGFKRMRIKPEHIVRALHEYGDGASLKKVREHLKQHDGVKVTRWAIRKWLIKYTHLLKKTSRNSVLQRLRGASTSMKNIPASKTTGNID